MSTQSLPSAREIEASAALWLVRSEAPDWSAGDRAALDAWLAQSMAHKAAYWRLEHGWRRADRLAALGSAAPLSFVRPKKAVGGWLPFALAAALVAMIGVGSVGTRVKRPGAVADAAFDTQVGGRRIVPLADGSRIELNTATRIRTAMTRNAREVWLDRGEAYFEVAHREGHSFTVHAGSRTVTVLGTKFSVRRDGDKVTVSVVEGRVRVDDGSKRAVGGSSVITAGDTAIAKGSTTLLAARSDERVENALAWRDGMLNFDNVTLRDAAAEFNRYTKTPIVIEDPSVAQIRIGGTFRASNVDAFVRLLRDAYGLRIQNNDDAVKISS